MKPYYNQAWFSYVSTPLQVLIQQSIDLQEREKENSRKFSDYAFVTFPMAQAYEGFLKQVLLDWNLVSKELYLSKKFRIGRALNPDLNFKYRDEDWLYDDFAEFCGQELARKVWDTWLTCRNQVFHFFPEKYRPLSLEEATKHLEMMADVMQATVECQVLIKSKGETS